MARREQLEERIREIIVDTLAESLGIDKDTITDETRPERDLGATSAVLVKVALALQAEYDITCSFMAFRRQKTVEAMVEFTADVIEE